MNILRRRPGGSNGSRGEVKKISPVRSGTRTPKRPGGCGGCKGRKASVIAK